MVSDAGTSDEMVWENLPKPVQGHPNELLLWETEEALRSIEELSEDPDIKNAFARRLEEYRAEILSAVSPIQAIEHNIAFMGNIGVGKTTAMCRIIGLEVPSDNKTTPEPVLEVGAGGTTVCEVALVQGADYGIRIEPKSEDEIRREVREFARYHLEALEKPEEESEEADSHGTSKEIERAIRNMSGLIISRERGADGRRVRIDSARFLAENFTGVESLSSEILERMTLHSRTTRELWHSQESGESPLAWLKEIFGQVNKGTHPGFSLPNRIEVRVPQQILAEDSLSIRVVDTKGIQDTAEREDLESHFRELNTVVILCSGFNDAPSPSVQQLLARGVEGQFPNLEDKVAVLVLPRPNEALAVKDDQGFTVDTTADGYELKSEQAEMRLAFQHLPFAGIECFNVHEDDPDALRGFLLNLVGSLREKHSERLREAVNGTNAMVQNFEAEQASAVLRAAARNLSVWLQNNGELGSPSGNLQDSLFQAMRTVHVSSLRASVNREGEWHKLDYPYQIGYGARVMAARTLASKRHAFQEVTQNLLNDPDLEDAHGLVEQARSIFESGINDILNSSRLRGREVHTRNLEPDTGFWSLCRSEWGRGSGYRNRVSGHHQVWFGNANPDVAQAAIQELIQTEWHQVLERVSAILPAD